MIDENKYPVSEIFTSPQGEGVYSGTMMTFVRLAGCSVGKPYSKETYATLPIYTEKCTLWDGRTFPCDTDYRKKELLTMPQITARIPKEVQHVCITGGEPLIHDLSFLIKTLRVIGKEIHLETSGTRIYWETEETMKNELRNVWVTVSPKEHVLQSMLNRADELKFLVDTTFQLQKPIELEILADMAKVKPVYLQPVNFENEINVQNLKMCMGLIEIYPQFRLSLQLHKVLSAYLEEHIR